MTPPRRGAPPKGRMQTAGLQVSQLLRDLSRMIDLNVIVPPDGVGQGVTDPRVQRPGLALTGRTARVDPHRVQVLGRNEVSYLNALRPARQARAVDHLCALRVPCVVVTRGLTPPARLVEGARRRHIALATTRLRTSEFIDRVSSYLESRLAERTSLHGVLVDVLGAGILLLGKSGVGKSECALDLVLKGHRMVADDVVEIEKQFPNTLIGSGSELIRYHMEIRGLGIINIKDLFGISSVLERKPIDLAIELMAWDEDVEYDRLGIQEETFKVLGTPVPLLRIPVRPGRNMTTIVEVAARNHILKLMGHHSALEFQRRLEEKLVRENPTPAAKGDR